MLRRICVALALAAIVPVMAWAVIGTEPTGEEPLLPAATLAAAGTTQTNAIPCFGAHQVVCILKATNANACSIATFEASMDSVNWVAVASWNGLSVQADSVVGKRLDQGGVPIILSTSKRDAAATASAMPYIPYRWCRMKATARGWSSGGDISGFAVETIVLRPSGIAETVGPVYQP